MDSEGIDWFLYGLASETNIAVLKWNADGCKQERHGDPLPGAVYPKIVPMYVEDYQDSGMKRYFADAVWKPFNTKGVDLRVIPSVKKQRAFV